MKKPLLPLLIPALLLTAGCGRFHAEAPQTPDQQQIAIAIEKLRSGETLETIQRLARENSTPPLGQELEPVPTPSATPIANPDPCPEVQTELSALGSCLREFMKPWEAASNAMLYLKLFKRSITERRLSQMADEEITAFITQNYHSPVKMSGLTLEEFPLKSKIRGFFEERDLDELARLARRRRLALDGAQSKFFAAVDAHRSLVESAAKQSNRWEALLALKDNAQDPSGVQAAKALRKIARKAKMTLPEAFSDTIDTEMAALIYPYALMAISPDEGKEAAPLSPTGENFFDRVVEAAADFGGSAVRVLKQRQLYLEHLSQDNPEMPTHAEAALGAVRVAVLDSGVDYVNVPELGVFLSQEGSLDLADDDQNPYLPQIGELGHGTATTASVLTTLAHHAPEVLRERKLDLSVWKIASIRELLAAPFQRASGWESRFGFSEVLIQTLHEKKLKALPQIVSVSAAFSIWPVLEFVKKEKTLLQSPWLWVMAAGNNGVETAQAPIPPCFADVPAENRPKDRIVCVGALKKGILEDRIAGYSNFGDSVDVYAYESYLDLCESGTSCSTPAITGALTALAAQYPDKSPEWLKSVLLSASEERDLEVEGSSERRKVRVFEPSSMMNRLFESARFRGSLTTLPSPQTP